MTAPTAAQLVTQITALVGQLAAMTSAGPGPVVKSSDARHGRTREARRYGDRHGRRL